MALSFSSVTISPNPTTTGNFLNISTQVVDGNASKWLMDSSGTYLRGSGSDYLLTTNTSGTSQINYTATQVNNILANIDNYQDLSDYLTETEAANTYQTQSGASNYLAKGDYAPSSAVNTYQNATAASNDYNTWYNTFTSIGNGTNSALALPTNTLWFTTSSSINPNNFLYGTWTLLTNVNAKGIDATSGGANKTITTTQTAYPSFSSSISLSIAHTHGLATTYYVGGSAAIKRISGKPSGSGYYLLYADDDTINRVKSTDTTPNGTEHSHTWTASSTYTTATSTVNVEQYGYEYFIWRRTS